jgi:cysteine desulfurase
MDGGGHERGFRSGTLNVPGIVGFGVAAAIASEEMGDEGTRVAVLRNALQLGIVSQVEDVTINGHPTHRLPNNLNVTIAGVDAARLMMDMKDIALSTGSACSSASPEPSHVLQAIGLSHEAVLSSIRLGLGRFTTSDEIEFAVESVVRTVRAIREKAYHPAHI